ncbi:MAG: hypothetical protein HY318_03910 [Armatimonadetes bacterium]|nr:hypothetical protein [Armatimonadota bacterium]
MRQMKALMTVLGLCLCVALGADAKLYDPPELVAPAVRTTAPPKIDGVLDDVCWNAATALGDFRSVHNGQPASEQTRCAFVWDATALYIGVTCLESALVPAVQKAHLLKANVKGRDSSVFADDCIEIFLSPDPSREYYQLAVNALGTQYDSRGLDSAWDGKWSCAAKLGEGNWTLEVAIPFASLGVAAPSKAATWRFNLCRDEQPKGEASSLCGVQGKFHAPEQFGSLVFVESLPGIAIASVGADAAGKAEAQVTLTPSPSAFNVKLRLETKAGDASRVADEKDWRSTGKPETVELHSKESVSAVRVSMIDIVSNLTLLRTLWTAIGATTRSIRCELASSRCEATLYVNGEEAQSLAADRRGIAALPLNLGANPVAVRCKAVGKDPCIAFRLVEFDGDGSNGWLVHQGFDKAWTTETSVTSEWKPALHVAKGIWGSAQAREITLRRVVYVPKEGPRNWPMSEDFHIPAKTSQVLYPLLEVPSGVPLDNYQVNVEVPAGLRLTAVDEVAGVAGLVVREQSTRRGRRYEIGVDNPSGAGMELNIRWGDGAKNLIAYVPGIRAGGTCDWRLVRRRLTSPEKAQFLHPLLIKWQESGVCGTAWFDNVVVREKGSTTNLLSVGTFEEAYWQEHTNWHLVEAERDGAKTRCCRLSGTPESEKNQDAMWVGDPIPVKPNTEYEFEAWVKCENVSSGKVVKPRLALLVSHEGGKLAAGPIRFGFQSSGGYVTELPASITVKPLPPLLKKRPKESHIMPCYYTDAFGTEVSRALVRNVLDSGIGGIYGGLHNQVSKEVQRKGVHVAWSFPYDSWQVFPAPDWPKDHPDRIAVGFDGKPDRNTICPTYALSAGNEFEPFLREWVRKSVKGCGYDEIDCDYEVPVVDPPLFCFCNRCIQGFRQEMKLSAEEKLSPQIVVEKYRDQWTAFRCRQNAAMIGLLARWIRGEEPKIKVTSYSGYQSKYTREHYGVDWSLLAPHLDMGIAGYNGSRQALRDSANALGNVPFVGGEMYYLSNSSDATGPLPREGWKLRLLRAYVDGGCNGVLIWWLPPMDGAAYFQTSQAAAIIADFEDIFRKGNRMDERMQLRPEVQAEDFAAFAKDGKVLLLLFNPTTRKRVVDSVQVQGWARMEWRRYDAVAGKLAGTTMGGRQVEIAAQEVAVLFAEN